MKEGKFILSKSVIIALFVIVSIALAVFGHLYFNYEKSKLESIIEDELETVANYKTNAVRDWMYERRSDVSFLFETQFMAKEIDNYLLSNDKLSRDNALIGFAKFQRLYNYHNIMVVDTNFNFILNVNKQDDFIHQQTIDLYKSNKNLKDLQMNYFYSDREQKAKFDYIYPIFKSNTNQAIAIVIVKIDPDIVMYPMLNSWHSSSKTAETVFFQKKNDIYEVVNPLKKDSSIKSLSLVINQSDTSMPLIKAFNHGFGFDITVDYKNDEVYSYTQKVIDGRFYLVVKIDKDEVLENLYSQIKINIIFMIAVVVLFAFLFIFVSKSKQQEIIQRFNQNEIQSKREIEKFVTTLDNIDESVIITDNNGNLIQFNKNALKLLVLNQEEIIGKNVSDLFDFANYENNNVIENPILQVIRTKVDLPDLNKIFKLVPKNGKESFVTFSVKQIKGIDGKLQFVVLIIQDMNEEINRNQIFETIEQKSIEIFRKFNDIQAVSKIASIEFDFFTESIWWSNQMYLMLELDKKSYKLKKTSYLDFIEDGYEGILDDLIKSAIDTNEVFQFEIPMKTSSNRIIETKWMGSVEYKDNLPFKININVKDITELKIQERAMADNLANYENLVDMSPESILVHRNGVIVYANRAYVQLVEADDIDMLAGQPIKKFVHPENHSLIDHRIQLLNEGHTPPLANIKILTSTGKIKITESSTSKFTDSEGTAYQVIMRDITERIENQERIKASEERLNLAISSTRIGVWEWNVQDNKFYWTKECLNLYGYESEKNFSQEIFESMIIPEDRDYYQNYYNLILRNKSKHFDFKFRIKRKDGKVIWIRDEGRIYYDEKNEKPIRIVGTNNDITDLEIHQRENQITIDLLKLLNQKQDLKDLMKNIAITLKEWIVCDAVGIRLREGEDFPYYETVGFSKDFVQKEKNLCNFNHHGELKRNPDGSLKLDCMCGHLLEGDIEPECEYFTSNKSFWTNSTSDIINDKMNEVNKLFTRGHCNKSGYESLALIPIKSEEQIHGLIQINSRQRDKFDSNLITFLERMATLISSSLAFRKAESELIANELKYRSLFENMVEAIVQCELTYKNNQVDDFIILNSNISFEKITGLNDVSGKKISELLPYHNPNNYPDLFNIYKEVAEKGLSFKEERYLIELGIWISMTLYSYQQGQFVMIFEDITMRKNNENQLRKLSRAVEQSPVTIVITDLDGKIEYVNPRFTITTGYTFEEALNNNPRLLKSNHTAKEDYQNLWETINSGNIWQGEFLNVKKNKDTYWELATIAPIHDDKGKISNFVAIKEDITERKNSQELIKESEAKFRSYIENAPVGIYITNTEGKFLEVNSKGATLLGYQMDEFLTLNLKDIIHSDNFERDLITFKQMLNGDLNAHEFYFKKKNGSGTWTSIFSTRISANSILSYCLNIDDIKKAEEELIIAKDKAEEMNKLKSSFLANMSHELRTPMIGILGFSHLMIEEEDLEEIHSMSKLIYSSGKRLMDTLNSILDLSKIESGYSPVNYIRFDLIALLNELVKLFVGEAYKKHLELELKLQHNELIIMSDKKVVSDIINNLLNNAVKFTSSGSVTIYESIIYIEEKSFIKLDVVDTGIGIDEKSIEFIFDEFRQGSEGISRAYEGSGLGLTLSKKYAQLLKGDLSVKSQLDKGSTFSLILPYIEHSDSKQNPHNIDVEKVTINQSEVAPKQILYVEDDDLSIHYVKRIIPNPHKLLIAENSIQAIEVLENNKIDLIIMDMSLGNNESGLMVIQIIKELSDFKHIPIIACTAYAMHGDRDDLLRNGCDDYISKPYERDELLELLKKWIEL